MNLKKSQVIGFVLTFLFGPLGLLYASVAAGLIMMLVSIVAGVITLGTGLIICWPITWIVSFIMINKHNKAVDDLAAGNSGQPS